jgi:hypothetical protein
MPKRYVCEACGSKASGPAALENHTMLRHGTSRVTGTQQGHMEPATPEVRRAMVASFLDMLEPIEPEDALAMIEAELRKRRSVTQEKETQA